MFAASMGKEEEEGTVQQAVLPKRSGTANSGDASECCLRFRLCLHLHQQGPGSALGVLGGAETGSRWEMPPWPPGRPSLPRWKGAHA